LNVEWLSALQMVRFTESAAAHNVAGDETVRLIYHRAILKSKSSANCLFALQLEMKRAAHRGRP